jgi:hypothetical protein
MKTRVIKYDRSGTKVVNAFLELEPVDENVFKAFYKAAEYGGPSQDIFIIVFRINKVYFSIGHTSRVSFERDENCKLLAEMCRTWTQDVMERVARHDYIRLLEIRVFEKLGMDTGPLWQIRKSVENRRKEESRLREEKATKERIRREKEHNEMLEKQKRRFLAGEKIQPEHFLEFAKRDGFEIHIRTKGTFVKSVRMLDKNGTIHYVRTKGKRKPDFTGCQKAIMDYLRLLLSKRIEQRLLECGVSSDLWGMVSDSLKRTIIPSGLYIKPLQRDSIINEVARKLTDQTLVKKHGVSLKDMCNENGKFCGLFQDEFNSLYDRIKKALTDN